MPRGALASVLNFVPIFTGGDRDVLWRAPDAVLFLSPDSNPPLCWFEGRQFKWTCVERGESRHRCLRSLACGAHVPHLRCSKMDRNSGKFFARCGHVIFPVNQSITLAAHSQVAVFFIGGKTSQQARLNSVCYKQKSAKLLKCPMVVSKRWARAAIRQAVILG